MSSSRIRTNLLGGELDWANACLGRPYRLVGQCAPAAGWHQFESLPAIELTVAFERLIPAPGAYGCRATTSDLPDQPCLAYVKGQGDIGGGGTAIAVYPLDAGGASRSGRMDLDFVTLLRGGAPGRALIRDRSLLLEDAQRALALLSRPN